MNIQTIQEKLKSQQLFDSIIQKYTLLIDEKMIEQGALFFVPLGGKEIKIVLPAPLHKDFLADESQITYKKLLLQKEIIILK
ncbi:hypothetical protein [Sphingobacterium bovistauri]|uniref:Uncharacterized protein n=1 Tax=Sphingobacterium bovistauri TaxID=2781959 RepID=A0ABS7Z430_9SPHI|nr:hypothetical protein [Sphingobacterium bovistauri]MCA5004912.1 hypothetical protein [Sphingobacterium bovistauri]